MKVQAIPAFDSNYIWLIINDESASCVVVDPGDAAPVLSYLYENKLTLEGVLITHHHHDHVDGVKTLVEGTKVPVVGPKGIEFVTHDVAEGDHMQFTDTAVEFEVIEVPGHTLDHIAYYGGDALFCGDALFSVGCGRVFEGTALQSYQSIERLASLPEQTKVYCTHEYTQANIAFAKTIDADNQSLIAYEQQVKALREKGKPSLPTTIWMEKQVNPFVRCHDKSLASAVDCEGKSSMEVFSVIRRMKDNF
jgi:hydroxyacylglutathione hydrolase